MTTLRCSDFWLVLFLIAILIIGATGCLVRDAQSGGMGKISEKALRESEARYSASIRKG